LCVVAITRPATGTTQIGDQTDTTPADHTRTHHSVTVTLPQEGEQTAIAGSSSGVIIAVICSIVGVILIALVLVIVLSRTKPEIMPVFLVKTFGGAQGRQQLGGRETGVENTIYTSTQDVEAKSGIMGPATSEGGTI
jgi:hypothetical protein